MRRLSLRRSEQEPAVEQDVTERPPAETAPKRDQTTSRTRWRRGGPAARIELAADRAAAAARTAAARAATARAHARPRTSALASLALVLAVTAALAVATGALAGLGLMLGVAALLVSLGAASATGRRYHFLAGRGEATFALLLAVAAVVVGAMAVAGTLSWLDTDTNHVQWLRDQLPAWLR